MKTVLKIRGQEEKEPEEIIEVWLETDSSGKIELLSRRERDSYKFEFELFSDGSWRKAKFGNFNDKGRE